MFKKIKQFIKQHRLISAIVAIILVLGGYLSYNSFADKSAQTLYVLAAVQKDTLISSISGSGQVSASQQIDVKPKTSGTVTYIGVKAGQEVFQGQIIGQLDDQDAQRAVRDAQINLESAQIALEKLKRNQKASGETTSDNLEQSYKDAYNKVSDAFLNLPNLIETARGVLYDSTVGSNCNNICEYENLAKQDFRSSFKLLTDRSQNDYKAAKDAFDPNFASYRNVRLDASPEEIISILTTTEKTSELLAQAIKSEQNMLDALTNNISDEAAKQNRPARIPQQIQTYKININSAIGQLNSTLSSLGNSRRAIESAKRSLEDSNLTNPIDMSTQENTVKQRQASLQDAQENLSNYSIRAPFAGTVASTDIKKGDTTSANTVLATLLTKQNIAEISFNEIDIAKLKLGQKATLTFDAVEGLTIAGTVAEIDLLGTVTQGVVNYNVKIGFVTQDARIKPGMSVSSSIILNSKQNILVIPSSAIKSANGTSYVEIPEDASSTLQQSLAQIGNSGTPLTLPPRRQTVEAGLSDDSSTEIISGLKEGDIIISRTINAGGTTKTAQPTQGLFPTGGGTRFVR